MRTFVLRILCTMLSLVSVAAAQEVIPLYPRIAPGSTQQNQPAELHMYEKGGHGFGMRKQNIPTDHWIDRFTDWMQQQSFLSN